MSYEGFTSQLAIIIGCFYFLYALKYYISSLIALFKVRSIKDYNLTNEKLNQSLIKDHNLPFISIHIPFYNEVNVSRRILEACIAIDYPRFEVLVADDSIDETVKIIREQGWRRTTSIIKFVHRSDRTGYKGGALKEALKYIHPGTGFIVVFDADFIPPTGILRDFMYQFTVFKEKYGEKLAAVQGYQLHFLNRNENWLTKGVRAEYSGSYMVERVAKEVSGAMKMVSGSVFMFRADLLKQLGWTTSITEDWELTLRLYLEGYKVAYTPLIQSPAEIPNTITRLRKQRMRWAEGHTHAVRKYFKDILFSSKISITEKLEFLYYAPYYLQSLFFIAGTLCWVLSDVSGVCPDYWNSRLGWGLVAWNFCALPFMEATGLFLEGDLKQDYSGIFSFIVLSFILTPYQAYAALKGLLETEESSWVRTLKTGTVTDRVLSLKLRSSLSLRTLFQAIRNALFTDSEKGGDSDG